MPSSLMTENHTCWRCGGAGTIAKGTTQCPGCSGTGEQARLRPTRSEFRPCGDCISPLTCEDQGDYGRCPAVPACVLCGAPDDHGVDCEEQLQASRIHPRADQPCSSCGGSGYRMVTVRLPDGRYETRTDPCTGCGGSGRVQ